MRFMIEVQNVFYHEARVTRRIRSFPLANGVSRNDADASG